MPNVRALVLNAFESSGRDAGWELLWVCNERDTEPPKFSGPHSVVLPLWGEAHPRGSRSNSDAPWWDTRGDRGTVPSQQESQAFGFLQTISAEGGHFVSRFWFETGMKNE